MTMLVPQGSANFAHFAFSVIFFADSGLQGLQLFASMALTGEKQLQTTNTFGNFFAVEESFSMGKNVQPFSRNVFVGYGNYLQKVETKIHFRFYLRISLISWL